METQKKRIIGVTGGVGAGKSTVLALLREKFGADVFLADTCAHEIKMCIRDSRHTMYDAYKGTRKPMPEELHEQVPLMKEVLTAMGIPIFTREGYEADDILGTVAKKAQAAGMEVTVVSGDRDLLQLSDAHIKISIPKTSRGTTEVHTYYPEDVEVYKRQAWRNGRRIRLKI